MPLLFLFLWLGIETLTSIAIINALGFIPSLALWLAGFFYGSYTFRQNLNAIEQHPYKILQALLFICPGFISSILALTLFIAPLRHFIARHLWRAFRPEIIVRRFGQTAHPDPERQIKVKNENGETIEAEILEKRK